MKEGMRDRMSDRVRECGIAWETECGNAGSHGKRSAEMRIA
jgi:hypothetical protein